MVSLYDDSINTDNYYCHLIDGKKCKRSTHVMWNLRMLAEHLIDKNEDTNSSGNYQCRRQCLYKASTNLNILDYSRFQMIKPSQIIDFERNKGYYTKYPYSLPESHSNQ